MAMVTQTGPDLKTDEDVKMILFVLAESVGQRMREQGFKGRTVSEFEHDTVETQTDLYTDERRRICLERLDQALDGLKSRFGNHCVQRASLFTEPTLTGFDPKQENVIHPVGYF